MRVEAAVVVHPQTAITSEPRTPHAEPLPGRRVGFISGWASWHIRGDVLLDRAVLSLAARADG